MSREWHFSPSSLISVPKCFFGVCCLREGGVPVYSGTCVDFGAWLVLFGVACVFSSRGCVS